MDLSSSDRSSRSPRFTQWLSFLVFSTITMVSSVQEMRNTSEVKAAQKYAVFCASITFAISVLVVLMHFFSLSALIVVGTPIEGLICVILVTLWCFVVGVVNDARNDLAVDEDGNVTNGNLYYFSWAGFLCSVMLLVSYLRSAFDVDVAGEIRTRSARLNYWSAVLASSLVVMGSTTNLFISKCIEQSEDDSYCRRCKFGISLGSIGTILSLYSVASKIISTRAPFLCEAVLAILMFILYTFGVVFLTEADSPGSNIGNLYYFTWASFLASFALMANCYEDYQIAKNISATQQENYDGGDQTTDVPIETIVDDP